MAVTLIEGFDAYNGTGGSTATSAGLALRWYIAGTNIGLSATTPYGVGQAVNFSFGVSGKDMYTSVAASNAGAVGFAFRRNGAAAPNAPIVTFHYNIANANGRQIVLYLTTNNNLAVGVGPAGTIVFNATNAVIPNLTWTYIELEFTISNTTGTLNIYLNGELVDSASGLDTQGLTGDQYNILTFGTSDSSGYGFSALIDDVYLTDTASRLGEQRVATVVPASDATPSQWAASGGAVAPYTMVDEALCDGDSTYIYDGTLGDRAVFNMASTGATPLSVSAVQIGTFSRKTDTGMRGIQLQYVDGGGTAYNSSEFILGASYGRQLSLLENNPATATAWTPAEANSLKAGVRIST